MKNRQKERETLLALAGWHDRHYVPPSWREMSELLGIGITSLRYRVYRLRARGLVAFDEGARRTLRLTEAGREALKKGGPQGFAGPAVSMGAGPSMGN